MILLARENFAFRAVAYFLLVTLVFEVNRQLVGHFTWQQVFREGGVVEVSQVVILALTGAGFGLLAMRRVELRGAYAIMVCFLVLAFIREFNNAPGYRIVFRHGWVGWVVGAVALSLLLVRYGKSIPASIARLKSRPSAVLLVFGFLLVVAWAQVLAQRELLESKQDRIVEESLELAGYILIFCGLIEEAIFREKPMLAVGQE